MRININMSEELVKKIDEIAKGMYISRSAYISTAVAAKLQQDSLIEKIPDMLIAIKAMSSETEKSKNKTPKSKEEHKNNATDVLKGQTTITD